MRDQETEAKVTIFEVTICHLQFQVLSQPCSHFHYTEWDFITSGEGTQRVAACRRDLPTFVSFPLLFYSAALTISQSLHKPIQCSKPAES